MSCQVAKYLFILLKEHESVKHKFKYIEVEKGVMKTMQEIVNNPYAEADILIFDLDGTLYEDTEHFAYYAEQLKEELSQELHASFTGDYQQILEGKHPVSIGKVYDVVRQYILQVDFQMNVLHGWEWNGTELNKDKLAQLYPHPLHCDFDTMIAIGDGWWLPNVVARYYGAQDTYTAYQKTKDFMATDAFQLTKISGLREGLLHLKNKKEVILVTNSQPDDVQRLLTELELQDIFTDIVTEARKPEMTIKHFEHLLSKYNVPAHKAISIGDNYLNEIIPAHKLGMATLFIDFFELDYPEYTGVKVQSIANTIEWMLDV